MLGKKRVLRKKRVLGKKRVEALVAHGILRAGYRRVEKRERKVCTLDLDFSFDQNIGIVRHEGPLLNSNQEHAPIKPSAT